MFYCKNIITKCLNNEVKPKNCSEKKNVDKKLRVGLKILEFGSR